MAQRAVVYVSEADLCWALQHYVKLPEGYRILRVRESTDRFGFVLQVEGPDLPEVAPGHNPPELRSSVVKEQVTKLVVAPYMPLEFPPP